MRRPLEQLPLLPHMYPGRTFQNTRNRSKLLTRLEVPIKSLSDSAPPRQQISQRGSPVTHQISRSVAIVHLTTAATRPSDVDAFKIRRGMSEYTFSPYTRSHTLAKTHTHIQGLLFNIYNMLIWSLLHILLKGRRFCKLIRRSRSLKLSRHV